LKENVRNLEFRRFKIKGNKLIGETCYNLLEREQNSW